MSRPLRADRYAEGASPSLVQIITDKLPYFTFEEAMDFYGSLVGHLNANEMALLGCNDRFFLLTGLFNRVDAIHPWIYDRTREVEIDPDGHLDLWSRFHYKSSTITFAGSIQEALVDPEIRICIFSNNKNIARPFLKQIKDELESNELLRQIYADVLWQYPAKESPTWSLEDGLTIKRNSNPRECTFEAHGLIDALPTGKHFPLLIYDDVITLKNVTNPEQIKKATERTELSFPLGDGERTRKWFVGTRYSYNDTYGHLLEKKIAHPRIYPATDDGTMDGNPVFMSPEAWAKTKNEMRSQIAAQMLQNPIAGKENTFLAKWLQPYWVRPLMLNVYIMGDPSKGKSKTSDRTALAVVGIDTAGNKYLLDGYCHRMPLSERWTRLVDLHKRWSKMPGVQLVKVGYERYGMQSDEEYFEEKMRLTGYRFEIIELNWTGDAGRESKPKRVERLEPDFRNGRFYVPGRVWHADVEGKVARWRIKDPEVEADRDEPDEFIYRMNPGPHQLEQRAKASGEHWRVFDPIRRVDEDGNIYDLTRHFFLEFRFFPFSPHDDLIDAVSRIYDMDPRPAIKHETIEVVDYADS
jgi:hypothetical protein